jgi:membrane protein required for colicin V production
MSVFDIVFVAMVTVSAAIGLWKGFILQLFGLIGLFVGVFVAYRLSMKLAGWWANHFAVDIVAAKVVTFIILMIVVCVLIILCAKLLTKVASFTMLGWVNRLLGMIFGIAQTVLIFAATVYAIDNLKLSEISSLKKDLSKSVTYKPLTETAKLVFPYMKFYPRITNMDLPASL